MIFMKYFSSFLSFLWSLNICSITHFVRFSTYDFLSTVFYSLTFCCFFQTLRYLWMSSSLFHYTYTSIQKILQIEYYWYKKTYPALSVDKFLIKKTTYKFVFHCKTRCLLDRIQWFNNLCVAQFWNEQYKFCCLFINTFKSKFKLTT